MTDAELSKKLGRWQAIESLGILGGIICIIAACLLAIVLYDIIILSILSFAGTAFFLLMALPAKKKKKVLIQEQFGGYFRAELAKFFGAEPDVPELPIDESFLKNSELICFSWTKCSIEDFHEGIYNGLRFSAANAELSRTIEERTSPREDDWMTRSETLFRGIVLRCQNICNPALHLTLNDRFQKRTESDITDPAVFRQYFAARCADGRCDDEVTTPALRELVQKLEVIARGRVCGLSLKNGSMTLALETKYVFATIPASHDLRDIDGIRRWFTASLTGMTNLLNLLKNSPALTTNH